MAKTLFVDMDNTLTDFNSAACEWFNLKLGRAVDPGELTEYAVWKHYGLSEAEGEKLTREMFATDGFWRNMDPLRGCNNALKRLSKQYDVYVVTRAVWNYNCPFEKYEWVKVHLPWLSEKLIMTEHKHLLSGFALVDDDYRNLIYFQGKRVLFMQYYNKHMQQFGFHPANWAEVEELLSGVT